MDKFRFLHITDLHWGHPGPKTTDSIISGFKSLMMSAENPIKDGVDAIFCTGDIVYKSNYKDINSLNQFLILIKNEISPNKLPLLFVVPGNHDLVEKGEKDPFPTSILDYINDSGKYDLLSKNHEEFIKWVNSDKEFCENPKVIEGTIPGDFYYNFKAERFNIGIIGLNSSFLQMDREIGVKGKLEIVSTQLDVVDKIHFSDVLNKNDLNILLTHHPKSWLKNEQHYGVNIFSSCYDSLLHLSGHTHIPQTGEYQVLGTADEGYKFSIGRSLQGWRTIETKKNEILHDTSYGFSYGEISFNSKIELKLYPFMLQEHGDNRNIFVIDPKAVSSTERCYVSTTYNRKTVCKSGSKTKKDKPSYIQSMKPCEDLVHKVKVYLQDKLNSENDHEQAYLKLLIEKYNSINIDGLLSLLINKPVPESIAKIELAFKEFKDSDLTNKNKIIILKNIWDYIVDIVENICLLSIDCAWIEHARSMKSDGYNAYVIKVAKNLPMEIAWCALNDIRIKLDFIDTSKDRSEKESSNCLGSCPDVSALVGDAAIMHIIRSFLENINPGQTEYEGFNKEELIREFDAVVDGALDREKVPFIQGEKNLINAILSIQVINKDGQDILKKLGYFMIDKECVDEIFIQTEEKIIFNIMSLFKLNPRSKR